MKARTLITTLAMAAAAQAFATQPADSTKTLPIISRLAEGSVTVIMPEGLESRLSGVKAEQEESDTPSTNTTTNRNTSRVGYRVQIFDDNNVRTAKREAQARKNQIESRFPEYRAYISFNSPYWRVKVGDFHSRSEAEAAMGAIRQAFPAMGNQLRVVRDRINP
ncbi:MAG: SPOR domain-containing protein [Bacteroidales bacterium]|nr:SPOR domain-containing protein [Bacteroidales bacterium]